MEFKAEASIARSSSFRPIDIKKAAIAADQNMVAVGEGEARQALTIYQIQNVNGKLLANHRNQNDTRGGLAHGKWKQGRGKKGGLGRC